MGEEAYYSDLWGIYRKFKPHLLMVIAQICFTFLYFITEASFNHGMNPYVYITYRHIVSGLVMLPFAYVLERNKRPKLTFALFLELFVISLLGIGLTINMYFASLRYTSPTFIASMFNTIASLTFVIAVVLRLLIHIQGKSSIHENWLKDSFLTATSCITWSIWYIMQAVTLKRYPAQLSLTTWMSFLGAAQSGAFSQCIEHRRTAWTIGFNVDLWSILYSVGSVSLGTVCSGLIIFIQLWCTHKKRPVFVAMFDPISTIFVAFVAYFVLGERFYTGSIVGASVVIVGLYMLLWGKEGDQVYIKPEESSYKTTYQEEEDNNIQ